MATKEEKIKKEKLDKAEDDIISKEMKNTIAEVVVPSTGEVLLTYSFEIHGDQWDTLAKNMAARKGWEVRYR